MIRTFAKQLASTVLSFLLVVATTPLEIRAQQSAPSGIAVGTAGASVRGRAAENYRSHRALPGLAGRPDSGRRDVSRPGWVRLRTGFTRTTL